ncbi:MAG: hypothetical protein ABSA46_20710 [Thermodesulfovibrionales bacterium]|jgi:hypothetical protein
MINNIEIKGKDRKDLRVAGYLFSYLVILFWGMAIVKWQVPPYEVYVWGKRVLGLPRYLGPDAELSRRFAFVDPLVEAKNQIDAPIQNMQQVHERVRKLELDVSRFYNAFEKLHVLNTSFLKPNVFSLDFELGRQYTTYCYFEKSLSGSSHTAILLIPGSGYNQSSAILPGGLRNYHDGLYQVARNHGDVFVYIKPNEDIRAIHNGEHKLSYDFITNTLISHGGSYSAYYVVETMAITKFLEKKYERVIVAGVSQGASAALLNGIQSWPDSVISIAAGYYPSDNYAYHSSPFNIMIPGLSITVKPATILNSIRIHSTRWLFTLGKLDVGGARVAYEEDQLSRYFNKVEQVTIEKHSNSHDVPGPLIDDYLSKLPMWRTKGNLR